MCRNVTVSLAQESGSRSSNNPTQPHKNTDPFVDKEYIFFIDFFINPIELEYDDFMTDLLLKMA